MLNILSYLGMSMQSEVCLWTLLGLLRTIFDATLFKVNANLKQVWQMTMPRELTLPVQRVLRTMISGVMLVQCFTLYVFLAAYIVLLYPVFLEERPNLVLPWLLLAAIRKLLCELLSIAMGLGVCVLLGPARPPCVRFVVVKFVSIMPSFYMWMLMFSYYHSLKNSWSYKSFASVHKTEGSDFGLELAVRRRRTKSLLDEDQLRKKLITNYYNEESIPALATLPSSAAFSSDTSSIPSSDNIEPLRNIQVPNAVPSNRLLAEFISETDGTDLVVPRNVDRILEQFILMMLKIGSFLNKKGIDPVMLLSASSVPDITPKNEYSNNLSIPPLFTESPQNTVGSTKENTATFMRNHPHLFKKTKVSDSGSYLPATDQTPNVPIYTNKHLSQPQNKSVHLTTQNRTPATAPTNDTFVSQNPSRQVSSTNTRIKSPRKALDSTPREVKIKRTDKSVSPSENKPFIPRANALHTVKSKTVTRTKVTRTKSITITPPASGSHREPVQPKELRVVKYEHKRCTTIHTPSNNPSNIDVTDNTDVTIMGVSDLSSNGNGNKSKSETKMQ